MPDRKPDNIVLNALMKEWNLNNQSAQMQREVKAILMELSPEAQLGLRNEPKLQVEIAAGGLDMVWAYFPAHRRRWIARRFTIKPATRVLLVLGSQMFHKSKRTIQNTCTGRTLDATDCLRDHLGHALLYLRRPKARNECVDAEREWKECCAGGEPKSRLRRSAKNKRATPARK
jgi:hypothetical protein